jgi:hypothetical protein
MQAATASQKKKKKKNKTSNVPSQSTGRDRTKQHFIPIPNSQGPRPSPCHCRICHCTTRRLDALHRHPSSLNRSPRYPNLRTPLHLAPKARILNHYPPASLPAPSTAQHSTTPSTKNAPTPLYPDAYAHTHTRAYAIPHPHTFQNPPNPLPPTAQERSCPAWARNLARTPAATRVSGTAPANTNTSKASQPPASPPPAGAEYEQPLPTHVDEAPPAGLAGWPYRIAAAPSRPR